MVHCYEIKAVNGQANQQGVYAIVDIKQSKIICTEEPCLLVTEQPASDKAAIVRELVDQHRATGIPFKHKHLAAIIDCRHLQSCIKTSLAAKNPQDTGAFWADYNRLHPGGDTSELLGDLQGDARLQYRIYRNNAFQAGGNAGALFWDICRINHSCSPNAMWFWDAQRQKMEVRAVVDIADGRQIFHSYVKDDQLLEPRATRRSMLKTRYDFTCQCSACRDDKWTKQSDENRKAIRVFLKRPLGTDKNLLKAFAVSTSLHYCCRTKSRPGQGHRVLSQ
jgi:hypothetical protein